MKSDPVKLARKCREEAKLCCDADTAMLLTQIADQLDQLAHLSTALKTCVFPEAPFPRRGPMAKLSAPARRASRRAHQATRSEPGSQKRAVHA